MNITIVAYQSSYHDRDGSFHSEHEVLLCPTDNYAIQYCSHYLYKNFVECGRYGPCEWELTIMVDGIPMYDLDGDDRDFAYKLLKQAQTDAELKFQEYKNKKMLIEQQEKQKRLEHIQKNELEQYLKLKEKFGDQNV